MRLSTRELTHRLTRVSLEGRLDMQGTLAIEPDLVALAAADGARLLIDLGGVDYLASYGIRLLVHCAKENAAVGGGMALFGAQGMVRETLLMAGIPRLIPLCADEAAAAARVVE